MSSMSNLPERPVDPGWLGLREPVDARSRDSAAEAILNPLIGWLQDRLTRNGQNPGLRVLDLGAGTGANLRWLAPRLAELGGRAALAAQRWTLVDHDPRLHAWGPVTATTIRADVGDLGQVLADIGGTDLVTAAALLDLLDGPRLTTVVGTVVAHQVPALFSLNVTRAVVLDPPDPLDGPLAAAFDAHQQREGRLGPDAGHAAADLFRQGGWAVVEAQTPWRLASGQAELIEAWLAGRAEAAAEWQPRLAKAAQTWLERRRREWTSGELKAVIHHHDLLALPPSAVIVNAGRRAHPTR
jgi:hypothetical protein